MVQADGPARPTRRAKLALLLGAAALLATCGLWFTPMEGGERFTALNVAGVALAVACGIYAAVQAGRAGNRRLAALAIGAALAVVAAAILVVLALIAFVSRFE